MRQTYPLWSNKDMIHNTVSDFRSFSNKFKKRVATNELPLLINEKWKREERVFLSFSFLLHHLITYIVCVRKKNYLRMFWVFLRRYCTSSAHNLLMLSHNVLHLFWLNWYNNEQRLSDTGITELHIGDL